MKEGKLQQILHKYKDHKRLMWRNVCPQKWEALKKMDKFLEMYETEPGRNIKIYD